MINDNTTIPEYVTGLFLFIITMLLLIIFLQVMNETNIASGFSNILMILGVITCGIGGLYCIIQIRNKIVDKLESKFKNDFDLPNGD